MLAARVIARCATPRRRERRRRREDSQAPTETATLSAVDVPTPEAMRAAPPTPTCVAAPAGPTGSAAAAPEQRKSSASGNEKPPQRAEGRKSATARTSQQADRAPTLAMRLGGRSCVGSASVRAGSARLVCSRPDRAGRGSQRWPRLRRQPRARARSHTVPRPERSGRQGERRQGGCRSSEHDEERQSTRTRPAAERRTTATRIASSSDPEARLISAAPPLPAASASTFGRSSGVKADPSRTP